MKQIEGFQQHFIDQSGNVYSTHTRHNAKKPGVLHRISLWKKNGYWAVTLCAGGKQYSRYVHRLVLEAYVGKRPRGIQCRHRNGNPADCRLQNLEWGTRSENQMDRIRHGTHNRGIRHGMHKLTVDQVIEIRKLVAVGFQHKWLAKIYGVFKSTISHIVTGSTWGWVKEAHA